MADHTQPVTPGGSVSGVASLIEKGATVQDAVGISLGNVTDVDLNRQVLIIDGRPVGHDVFDVPLSSVASVRDNEVHLSVALDAQGAAPGVAPRFVKATAPVEPTPTPLTEPALAAGSTEPITDATFGSPIGTTVGATSSFTPSSSYTSPSPRESMPAGPAPSWAHAGDQYSDEGSMFGPTAMSLAGLGAAGLATAGYVWWRRRRRKSAWERALDLATDLTSNYGGYAADYASRVPPTWWAGLAAAAIPIAASAYALRPTQPSTADQVQAWLDSIGHVSRASTDDQPFLLRPFKRQSARSRLPNLGRRAERWGQYGSSPWERLVEAAAGLGLADWLASASQHLPARDRLTAYGDKRMSRMATYGLSAMGVALAGASIYALTRKGGHTSTTRIADVMTRRPQVLRPDASVAEAAALMRTLDIGAVPICDGGRLVGMLTDRDVAVRLAAEGRDPQLTRAQDIMSVGTTWASEDDPAEEAARIMREHRIRRLPIVDDHHNLVGIVSLGDLATDLGDDRLSGDTLEEISRP